MSLGHSICFTSVVLILQTSRAVGLHSCRQPRKCLAYASAARADTLPCCTAAVCAAVQSCAFLLVDLLGSYKVSPEMKKKSAEARQLLQQQQAKKVRGCCLTLLGVRVCLLGATISGHLHVTLVDPTESMWLAGG